MIGQKIYMIRPKEHGAVLTFSDGQRLEVDRQFMETEYPEPGGYYVDGQYIHGSKYEGEYNAR